MATNPFLKECPLPVFKLFLIAFAMLWYGCPKTPEDPLPPVEVNPAFELSPPIAKDISLKVLEKPNEAGNLLLVADFGKEEIKDEFHAFLVGEEKLVLRDDGKGGDEQSRDGRFSIIISEDLEALSVHLDSLLQKQLAGSDRPTFFEGRVMKAANVDELKSFDPKRLLVSHEALSLPIDIIRLLTPADPALKDHSLMITDPAVVEDPARTFTPCPGGGVGTPGGAWTFGHLIREMANTSVTGVTPEAFLMNWLQTWNANQAVNGDNVPSRNIQVIINAWQTLSGGTLNVDKAPFKLLAIVNRMDLRGSSGYGFSNAGEGRFVFCAIDHFTCQPLKNPEPFMVIFEYGIPKNNCPDIKAYGQEWFDLKLINPIGSPSYKVALENITRQFTAANLGGTKANGSALNQLRTNEFGLAELPWELREFVIDPATHQLTLTTVKQEPQVTYNQVHPSGSGTNVQWLANFVNTHQTAVENDKHKIPATDSGKNILGGKAHTMNATTYHWNCSLTPGSAFINSHKARFKLSLNTCSGCHGGDTNTGNFMHVAPGTSVSGVPARLSGFLTGSPAMSEFAFVVPDRASRPSIPPSGWEFNDLERRAQDLEKLVSQPCKPSFKVLAMARVLTEAPLTMTH